MSLSDNAFEIVKKRIASLLSIEQDSVSENDNLFAMGIDSMQMMTLLNELRAHNIHIRLRDLYQEPSLLGLKSLMKSAGPSVNKSREDSSIENQRSDHQEHTSDLVAPWPTMATGYGFSLTPVQHAYFVGRSSEQALGGVGCHLYQEFDGSGLGLAQLNTAIVQLIQRHPMLNVTFSADAKQSWQPKILWQGVCYHDLRHQEPQHQQDSMLALRDQLSHRVLDVEAGQCFDVQLVQLSEDRHRLIVDIDLLVMDAASFSLFFSELSALLQGSDLPPPIENYDFCSYLAQAEKTQAQARKLAEQFWLTKLDTLSPAPTLPLAHEPSKQIKPFFARRRQVYSESQWHQLKQLAAEHEVTPTMVLATVFAAVLSRWSGQEKLLLNLTLFDCLPLHKDIDRLLADFTNIVLLDTRLDQHSLIKSIRAVQTEFADVYEHRSVSGVEVLRQLRKQESHPHGAPIVFTSNLGRSLYGEDTEQALGQLGWGISQTPQVWIDFVAYEHCDQLYLQWDSNEALFPSGLLDAMFEAFNQLVLNLTVNRQAWSEPIPNALPAIQHAVRLWLNSQITVPLSESLLHDAIIAHAQQSPDADALIDGDQSICYGLLLEKAGRLAAALIAQEVQAGERVAISMDKGEGQIIAALGILLAGAVYVPVPPNQPESRRQQIYRSAAIGKVIVCDKNRQAYSWPEGVDYLSWQQAQEHHPVSKNVSEQRRRSPDDEAYIIYTSGSTGSPKGVVISHRGALNTCLDINHRHQVNTSDRVLGLSALHFDLSVYDIFGVLSAGGALVLPRESQRRDPQAWCQLIEQHKITLWNTVPALFDMLLTFAEGLDNRSPALLRVVMLSGDWIGLTLPQRYRQFNHSGTLSAMGGATEASIWSNEYIVSHVDPQWRSIPYGLPLSYQRYRVVDSIGRDCPDWVPGELWIGGVGVAMGYCNNPEQSRAQFVEDGDERWYRTGDMGCYWPDGTLEFLGRKDNQVKVGGYRIELAEVDAGIRRVPGVKEGIALATGDRDKQLLAFIVLESPALEIAARMHKQKQPEAALPKNYGELFTAVDRESDPHARFTSHLLLKHFLLSHFRHCGLSLDGDCEKLAKDYGVCAQYRPLFYRWLDAVEQGLSAPVNSESGDQDAIAVADRLAQQHDAIAQIMRGNLAPEILLDTALAPEQLLFDDEENFADQRALVEAIRSLSATLERPVKVVEYGCRSGLHGERLVALLSAMQLQYLGLEHSQTLVQQAKKRLEIFAYAEAEKLQNDTLEQWRHQADIVLINNQLHVQPRPQKALQEALTMAAPAAMVVVLEVADKSPLTLISADLLSPSSAESTGAFVLRSQQQWLEIFRHCQLVLDHQWRSQNHFAFALRQQSSLAIPDHDAVLNALQQELPQYMVPRRLVFLEALPLSPNGKINRRALLDRVNDATEVKDTRATEPPHVHLATPEERALANIWQQILDCNTLNRDSDFFRLGGDSLAATRCIGALKEQGYLGDLGQLFALPCLHKFAATLTKKSASTEEEQVFVSDEEHRYQPFPLTEVQQAYWIGRQPGFALSGVGSHFFIEFSVDALDLNRFDQAWNHLIRRHEMLRVVVRKHQQQILPQVPRFSTRVYSVDDVNGEAANGIREQQAQQILDPACWPVFDVQAIHDSQDQYRVLISLDNMLLDGLSMQIVLNELQMLYHNTSVSLPEISISFRDYVLNQQGKVTDNNQELNSAKHYWRQQVATLPPPPALPLQQAPESVGKPKFIRVAAHLKAEQWRALKHLAQRHHITPSTLLVGAYGAVLSQWSQQSELTINLTLFDRQPVHTEIHRILGDFTSLLLVPWKTESSWLASIKQLQQKTVEGLQHSQVSAVWVMRELAQRQQQVDAAMPVVFTSALGTGSHDFLSKKSWLKPLGGISQTPQIWLDHQVYEADEELRFNWDAVEALLPEALLAKMFGDYCELLTTLAQQASVWLLPISELITPLHQRPEAIELLDATKRRAAEFAEQFVPTRKDASHTPSKASPKSTQENSATTASFKLRDQAHLCRVIEKHFHSVTGLTIQSDKNFFDAGASSLHLVQLHIALQKTGFEQLQVTDVFAYPSPSALAHYLASENSVDDNEASDDADPHAAKPPIATHGDLLSDERLSRGHREKRRQRRQKISEASD